MMLADYLLLLSSHELTDLYDTLYGQDTPDILSDEQIRGAILRYWSDPARWDEMVAALSPTERQMVTRLALGERCPINAFLEELNGFGLIILHREQNRYELADDVRVYLLERLPNLHDRSAAQEDGTTDGSAPV
jgi:hypothetical protein